MAKKRRKAVITPRYDKARATLDTGDIVLFSGKGGISAGIKWFTVSRWSHVGMALRLADYDTVLLWEATTLSNIADLESGRPLRGVQLVTLSERVKKYNGEIAVRHLAADRTAKMLKDLAALRLAVRGRPYEKNKLELIKAAYDGPFGQNEEDLSSLFCSELVAEAYQAMGLLPKTLASNELTPKDFSPAGKLPLQKGASLGKEILIKT